MASKKGRKNQSWTTTPFGLLAKTLSHVIFQHLRNDRGLRGNELRYSTWLTFERLLPYHQKRWARPRTVASIVGRGATTALASKIAEHPYLNKKTQPYAALANLLYDRNEPWPEEELDRMLAEVAGTCPVGSKPRRAASDGDTVKLGEAGGDGDGSVGVVAIIAAE
jgi:hypothetical protein